MLYGFIFMKISVLKRAVARYAGNSQMVYFLTGAKNQISVVNFLTSFNKSNVKFEKSVENKMRVC
mgnify:CR=1 FL=1